MKELKVGMYVRTKKGIAKILGRINDPTDFYHKMLITDKFLKIHGDTEYIHDLDIVKASENIIDLIEVGDYVNGYYVEDVFDTYIYVATGTNYFQSPTIYEQDIKSTVTREQFNSVKYEVE